MENITFPERKSKQLLVEENAEEQLAPEAYQEKMSDILSKLITLINVSTSLYEVHKTKELNDILIELHVAHENLIA
jgi:hypothetical protein